MKNLYTIGYEGADLDRFLTTLTDSGVKVVADVRAVALSRKRGFSKNALRDHLAEAGIGYEHFIALGTPKPGRDAAHAGDTATMRRIFGEHLEAESAKTALQAVGDLALARPTCLLCFERDPAMCHRTIVAERLKPRGLEPVALMVL
jgi:uncharacterized protein (DUF488 family)